MKKRYFVIVFIILLFLFTVAFFNVHSFLSPNKPVATAKILVVDGWLDDNELAQAARVFKQGNYEHVIVPGGKLQRSVFFHGMESTSELSSIVLMCNGVSHDKITPLFVKEVKKDRTYQSALTVEKWLRKKKIAGDVNLFTSSTHARRSWLLFKKAFGKSKAIGIIASKPVDYDANGWWKTSNGFRTVVNESIAYIYAFMFFHPNI